MKFLCGNCKAKYQIPDEKVVGRTLRMKCRRCNHDILIDGHGMPAAAAPAPPARRTGGSSVSVIPGPMRSGSGLGPLPGRPLPPVPTSPRSKPPASLGADFRRHVAAPPAVPARSAPYDLWHAAIQDVPVGPMTRDELRRKIEAGAVTAQSLCWREGMDDWRPLGELAELASLMRRSMVPGARPSSRPQGRMPPAVPGPVGSRGPVYDFDEIEDEGSEPTRIADMTGGHAPASAAAGHRQAGSTSQPRMPVAAPVPAPVAEAAAPAPAPAQRSGMSAAALIALGLLAGIVLLGLPMIIRQWWFPPAAAPAAQAAVVAAPEPKSVEPQAPELEVPAPVEPGTEPDPKNGKGRPRPKGPIVAKAPEPKPPAGDNLSDAERALLERMGGGGEAPIRGPKGDTGGGGGSPTGPALTASQLMRVVQDNRPALQRCYETALRSTGGKSNDAIKVIVEVVVGMSGSVKTVATNGAGLGNMNDCIRQSVKRWRFPQSGDESPFNFPVVFQPGA